MQPDDVRPLALAVGRALLSMGRPLDSVVATSVLVELLRARGVEAMPLVVELRAFNPRCVERIRELGRLPSTRELFAWARHGAHAVGIGTPMFDTRREWGGHLVASVPVQGGPVLVDCAAGLASRPAFDLHLPTALLTMIPLGFVMGSEPAAVHDLPSGARVVYTSWPHDRGYLRADRWVLRPELVAEAARLAVTLPAPS